MRLKQEIVGPPSPHKAYLVVEKPGDKILGIVFYPEDKDAWEEVYGPVFFVPCVVAGPISIGHS